MSTKTPTVDLRALDVEIQDVLEGLVIFCDNVIAAWDIKPLPADRVTLERARALVSAIEGE